MSVRIRIVITLLGVLTLISCGKEKEKGFAGDTQKIMETDSEQDSSSTDSGTMTLAVADSSALPGCSPGNENQLVYIKSEQKFKVCNSGLWNIIEIVGQKGEKGDTGEKGEAGDNGSGSIESNKILMGAAENLCTYYNTERCFFRGGLILKYKDGTVAINAVWRYSFLASDDSDSDFDQAATNLVVPPSVNYAYWTMHELVARGDGEYRYVFLFYDRPNDVVKIIYDSNDNGTPEPTDLILFNARTSNW